ncbi:MAG: hypothetical protein FD161_4160 [Limisphaerales bacterium]|nr:MAG: hypothetical protein FD161_4160 [Limisphaerales bacterium]KAG0507138.1 MAG: hypothetical protein E1N63_3693 [Limisphaerales bacterium]TXT47555.1 MAG: hypothetical protein FD140_4197 [Limisphaerales bacterium]
MRLLCLFVAFPLCAAPPASISKLPTADQRGRITSDQRAVMILRDGLKRTVEFARQRPDLFPEKRLSEARVLTREHKEAVWNTWKAYLDYTIALEATAGFHRDFLLLRRPAQDESFLVRCAAHFAQHRWALAFIARADNDPGMDVFLNEPVPELGLPRGTYAQLKLRHLNPVHAAHFGALAAYLRTVSGEVSPALRAVVREDEAEIFRGATGKTELLTAKNALEVIKQAGGSLWLPVQSGIAEWMGDTKVRRKNVSLITEQQARALPRQLVPGDVLITRRNWYLSNIGLPGFWPHAAIYLGTPEERRAHFTTPEFRAWLRTVVDADDFDALLKTRYPTAHATCQQPYHGHPVRVLEAQSEGVSFTSLEHAVEADALVVLRPKLSLVEKATALVRAFHYAGRPYDFNFDFATDAELVCTELVYKAYEPASAFTGLKLPLVEVLGRKTLPANEIVRHFDSTFGTPAQQFEFILFLDGDERTRKATDAPLAAFRESWKRPKWHVVSQTLPKLK